MKILDFSRLLPAPLGTQMLAELGATVWKIQRPQSPDPTQFLPPMQNGQSSLYTLLNHRKQLISIDFTTPEGRQLLLPYLQEADIIVESFRPNVMQLWQLDYDSVRLINPNIIYISVTAYGQSGDWANEPGHDLNFAALSGLLSLLRDPQGQPIMPNAQLGDIAGGAYPLVVAAQAAYIHRLQSRQGRFIDLNMTANLPNLFAYALSQQLANVHVETRGHLSGGIVNYNLYPTSDNRWVALAALEIKFWRNFCHAANHPEWLRDNLQELHINLFPKSHIDQFFRQHTQAHWTQWALGKDICLCPVIEINDWPQSPFAPQLIHSLPDGSQTLRLAPFWQH